MCRQCVFCTEALIWLTLSNETEKNWNSSIAALDLLLNEARSYQALDLHLRLSLGLRIKDLSHCLRSMSREAVIERVKFHFPGGAFRSYQKQLLTQIFSEHEFVGFQSNVASMCSYFKHAPLVEEELIKFTDNFDGSEFGQKLTNGLLQVFLQFFSKITHGTAQTKMKEALQSGSTHSIVQCVQECARMEAGTENTKMCPNFEVLLQKVMHANGEEQLCRNTTMKMKDPTYAPTDDVSPVSQTSNKSHLTNQNPGIFSGPPVTELFHRSTTTKESVPSTFQSLDPTESESNAVRHQPVTRGLRSSSNEIHLGSIHQRVGFDFQSSEAKLLQQSFVDSGSADPCLLHLGNDHLSSDKLLTSSFVGSESTDSQIRINHQSSNEFLPSFFVCSDSEDPNPDDDHQSTGEFVPSSFADLDDEVSSVEFMPTSFIGLEEKEPAVEFDLTSTEEFVPSSVQEVDSLSQESDSEKERKRMVLHQLPNLKQFLKPKHGMKSL